MDEKDLLGLPNKPVTKSDEQETRSQPRGRDDLHFWRLYPWMVAVLVFYRLYSLFVEYGTGTSPDLYLMAIWLNIAGGFLFALPLTYILTRLLRLMPIR